MDEVLKLLTPGDHFSVEFDLSERDLLGFIELSGDANDIHLDDIAATNSPIGKKAAPGLLSALVFSRILGTKFPGHGTVYKSQSLEFINPVILGRRYIAEFRVLSTVPRYHRARIDTCVIDRLTRELCIEGTAVVINRRRI